MPTTYAHFRFGDLCIKELPTDLQSIINDNRDIFNYGVHGPDIFFYYNCLKPNKVNQFGSDLHDIPFKDELAIMKKNYNKCSNKAEAMSYLLGFTAHFVLDSYCHSFIQKVDESTKYSHGKIESQFDRYLLSKDGFNPITKSTTESLKPSKSMAKTISTLFGEYDEKTIYKCLKDQKFYLNLLKDDSDLKRFFLIKAMDAFKKPGFKDLLISTEQLKDLESVNLRLDKLFDIALKHYPILANSLNGYFYDLNDLNIYFSNNFSYKDGYKQLKILSYEEEVNYKVDLQD